VVRDAVRSGTVSGGFPCSTGKIQGAFANLTDCLGKEAENSPVAERDSLSAKQGNPSQYEGAEGYEGLQEQG